MNFTITGPNDKGNLAALKIEQNKIFLSESELKIYKFRLDKLELHVVELGT